jgi:hypothetical protein
MPYADPADEAKRSRIYRQLRRTQAQRKEEVARSSTIGAPLASPAKELKIKGPSHGLRIAVVNDVQVRRGVKTDHIPAAGRYIADKQPDVVVCIGDWWDMPSGSDHEAPGSLNTEGQRYKKDVAVGCDAMEKFLEPIAKARGYNPKLIFTLGNHEDRILRMARKDPRRFTGETKDLRLEDYGWTVYPFLQPVVINGVAFCHYFPRGIMGKPIQSPTILLKELHMSAIAGHQQGRQIAYSRKADGKALTAIISGSFYQHDEPYMSPLSNRHWRGMWFLHEVKDGQFDEMPLSVNYLLRKWSK